MPALERREPVTIHSEIRNRDRTTGAMLSGEVATRYGHGGLPERHDQGEAQPASPARALALGSPMA